MKYLIIFSIFLFLFLSAFSCTLKKTPNSARFYTVGEKYYFGGVDLKQGPNTPYDRIPREEVSNHKTYFEVVFNRKQLVRSLRFIVKDNVIWSAEYTYHDNGIVKSRVWTEDGDKRTRYYSENGKFLRDN